MALRRQRKVKKKMDTFLGKNRVRKKKGSNEQNEQVP